MSDSEQGSVLQPKDFRDSLGTMEQSGTRKWIYPKKTKGKFTNNRDIVSYVLLIILFILPFIKVNGGNPIFLFNVIKRQFFFFGFPFYTQDFYLVAIGMVTTTVFIILFTVIYGRLFCGWICPQTIFMEMVFRKIEYAIEGDRNKQIRLDKQEWNSEKIMKKSLKWFLFAIISFAVSHTFLSYIIGVDSLLQIVVSGPLENLTTFISLLIFTGLFYFIFAWFREQVCTLVCPYGRLQGVLIDKKTINVTYDFVRGESSNGRSPWKRDEDRKKEGKGDCIDCNQCVVVCPTGIDIRNGLQLECVNCTACIDACDDVMVKVGLPKGLIRYSSEDEIVNNKKFKLTTRIYAYTGVLLALIGILISLLFMRSEVEAKILRVEGSKFKEVENNIVNTYQYTLLNKTNKNEYLTFKMINPKQGEIHVVGNKDLIEIKKEQTKKGILEISIPKTEIIKTSIKIKVGIYNKKGLLIDSYNSTFAGPLNIFN